MSNICKKKNLSPGGGVRDSNKKHLLLRARLLIVLLCISTMSSVAWPTWIKQMKAEATWAITSLNYSTMPISGPGILFEGESATYFTDNSATSYVWTLPTELTSADATSQFITVVATTVASPVTVTLNVKGFNAGGVEQFSENLSITINPKGLSINNKTTDICNDNRFKTLPDIVLTEKFFADFAEGSGVLKLSFSNASFEIHNIVPTVTFTTPTGQTNFTANLNSDTLEIVYNFDDVSQSQFNTLTISGLKVDVINSTNPSATLIPKDAANVTHFVGLNGSSAFATVNSLAAPGNITGFVTSAGKSPSILCTGKATTYEVNPLAGVTSYEWEVPAGVQGSSTTESIVLTAEEGAIDGNIRVRAVNSDGCVGDWITQAVTINTGPDQAKNIQGKATVCVGNENIFYVPALPGVKSAAGYEWELPTNVTTSDGTNTTGELYTTDANFIRLTASSASSTNADTTVTLKVRGKTDNCGDGQFSSDFSITIRAVPAITVNGIEQGQTFANNGPKVSLSATPTGGTFSGEGINGNEFFPATVDLAGVNTKSVTITYTGPVTAGQCPATRQIEVVVSKPSDIPGLGRSYCKNDTRTINFSIGQRLSANRYIVSLKTVNGLTGGPVSSSRPSCLPKAPVPTGALNYTFTPSNADNGVVRIEAWVVTNFNREGPIGVIDVKSVGGDPAPLKPIGILTPDCNVSSQVLTTIDINVVPKPTIQGPSTNICADNTTEYEYEVTNKFSDRDYQWSIPAGTGTITNATQQRATIKWNSAGNHEIKLVETNRSGLCKDSTTLGVTINSLPTPNITSGALNVCARSSQMYEASGGANYTWEVTEGRIVSGKNSPKVTVEWFDVNGTITVSSTQNGCVGKDTKTVVVDGLSAINLIGPSTVCATSSEIDYSITAADADDITWEVIGGTIVGGSTGSPSILAGKGITVKAIKVNWGEAGLGEIKVSKKTSTCTSSETRNIAIDKLPALKVTNILEKYCQTETEITVIPMVDGSATIPSGNGSLEVYAGTTISSGSTPLGGIVTGNAISITELVKVGLGKYTVRYRFKRDKNGNGMDDEGDCEGFSPSTTFEIIPQPTATFDFLINSMVSTNMNEDFCESDEKVEFKPGDVGGFFIIRQTKDKDNNDALTAYKKFDDKATSVGFTELNGTKTGTYEVRYVFQVSSCIDTSTTKTFKINPLPEVTMVDLPTDRCVREGGLVPLEVNLNGSLITNVSVALVPGKSYFEIRKKGNPAFKIMVDGSSLQKIFNPKQPIPSTPMLPATATTKEWNKLAGTYEIRYKFTDGNNCEQTSAVKEITIARLPEVTFSGLDNFYCIDAGEVTLEPFVDGGAPPATGTGEFKVYRHSDSSFVKNLSGNTFKPSVATVLPANGLREGDYFLEYRFTSDKNCTEISALQKFSIKAAPQVGFKLKDPPKDSIYCITATAVAFEPDQPGGFFTIKKAVGGAERILSKGRTSVNISELDGAGKYEVSYTFTDTKDCSGTLTKIDVFEIVPLPVLGIAGIDPKGYCVREAGLFELLPQISVGGVALGSTPTLDENDAFFEVRRVGGDPAFIKLRSPLTNNLTSMFNPSRPLSNEAAIDPDATTDEWNKIVGIYEVRYTYKDINGCKNTSAPAVIKINRLPKLTFTGLDSTYCDDVGLVTLTPFDGGSRINGTVNFKYRKVTETTFTAFTQGRSFKPSDLGSGSYEIVLESNASGCFNSSNRDSTVTILINSTPKDVRVVATRDYNKNTVQFSATAQNASDNWNWNWDFRDGTSATTQNPVKTLPNALPQIIRYSLVPSIEKGCNVSITKEFNIDFDIAGFCAGSATKFTNKTKLGKDSIGSVTWDFDDGSAPVTGDSVYHKYKKPGTYNVKLTVTTEDNIATYVLHRRIDIFPVVVVTEQQFYTEGFESGTGGWISHGVVDIDRILVDSTSWKLKQPDGFLIRNTTGNAWITDNRDNPSRTSTNANYNSNEQSYVESPCFDIGGLTKPMISFRYWSDTDRGADGVTLLYTVDDGKTWQRVGSEELGINWYDTKPILGRPGEFSNTANIKTNPDDQGWSGQSQIIDGKWRFARYSLTEALVKMNDLKITNKIVRFRMSFGSNGDNPPDKNFDGFAFDNVVIGNRNRIVLLEYFINEGIANAEAADLRTKNFPQTGNQNEVISIHHHTNFPGIDALNQQNEKDPSARSFYHGIREVPRVVIDGYFNDTLMAQWTQDYFADRTLIASPFHINVGQPSVSGTTFKVSASVTAIQNFDRPVIMHVVLIDSVVNVNGKTFYNVVRKMLPDAAGTYKKTGWALGDSETLDFSWDIGSLDAKSFRVVVFVEDYETKEVHQAAVTNVRRNRSNEGQSKYQVTSVAEDLLHSGGKIFPNPALKTIQVQLDTGRKLSAGATWEVISIKGALVKKGVWKPGRQSMSIGVSELSDGFYIFRIIDQAKKLQLQLRFEKQ